ncbi:MAG: J domain-containing protein [Halolamina sp.]
MEFDRDTLGIVLAGVFAGLAVLLAVVALVKQPFLLLAALPFAAAAYLVWMGATGRTPFGERRRASPEAARQARANREEREPGSAQSRFGREARRNAAGDRTNRRGRARAGSRQRAQSETLARREAARILGVDADAEPAAVRSAYRESVKEVHPDAEGGDEEAFQRVNEAYERLQEEP